MLQDLEEANAFVVSLDPARTWFRYHHLFADLLQLELRRTEPGVMTALHQRAVAGSPTTATRSRRSAARRPRDWDPAARLLADHWLSVYLDGRLATVHALGSVSLVRRGKLQCLG